ncbi:hypothetical protein C4D60_Mb04t38810 [Musa balbisiana]|uniref:Uncharacterized protein n=1 Tax=Musa balbisiana TaxID=52838 RepID=A0A4S8KHS9_MUSBA|nr:hypothetical protein C4D60_Mb04t38810 [Musa balbisiana]
MGRSPCCDKATVKKGQWSPDEDVKLKWSVMASQLPGRTDNDIKNYWNTRLKKKLFGERPKEPLHSRRGSACRQNQEAKGDDNGDWREQPSLVYLTDHVMEASNGGPLVVPSSTLPRQQICDVDDDGDLNGLAWSSLLGTPGGQALQDPSGFSFELDEVLGFNQANLEESNVTAESEKMNWNEVSPLLYSDPVIKGCEGMQQYLPQEQMSCTQEYMSAVTPSKLEEGH